MLAATLDRTDPLNPPNDAGHGPECPYGNGQHPWHWDALKRQWRRRDGRGLSDCQCVMCHCGDDHEPGGPVGACRRCHRPLVRDGRVVR